MDDVTLFSIDGREAKLLRLLVGTPFLFVGGIMVLVGLLAGTTQETAIAVGVGSVVGLVGVRFYVTAFRGKEIAVTLGGDSDGDDGILDGGFDGGDGGFGGDGGGGGGE